MNRCQEYMPAKASWLCITIAERSLLGEIVKRIDNLAVEAQLEV